MSLWRLVEGKYCHQVVICRNFGPIYIIGDFLFNSFPSNYHSNNNQTSVAPIPSASSNVIGSSALTSTSSLVITSPSNLTDLKECSGSRKARVLYDYDAANSTELSLLADEVSNVDIKRKLCHSLTQPSSVTKCKFIITYVEIVYYECFYRLQMIVLTFYKFLTTIF